MNKLAKPLQAIIEVISNTLGKLPAGAKLTVETLFSILKSYINILIKGTKSVIELINKIFEAVLGWIVSLMRGAYLVTLASGRIVTAQLLAGAELIIKLGMQAATILVRNNLNRLSLKVLFYEGKYFVKYGDLEIFNGDSKAAKNFLDEVLDKEENAAKKHLDEMAERKTNIPARLEEMKKWIDVRTKDLYAPHELETLANAEVRYNTELRPSKLDEAGDAIGTLGKWKDKSFDAIGTTERAFKSNRWKYQYDDQLRSLIESIDRHFLKISSPKQGLPPLDKIILDFKNYDEFDPELRKKIMNHIEAKYPQYLNTDFLYIIN